MPGWGNFVLDIGFKAESAITKYRFVKMGAADEQVVPVAAATDNPIGVAQYSVSAGELALKKDVDVRLIGVSECECSAAVTRGLRVGMATDGRVKNVATGERVVGIALASTANAGERLPVLISLASQLEP